MAQVREKFEIIQKFKSSSSKWKKTSFTYPAVVLNRTARVFESCLKNLPPICVFVLFNSVARRENERPMVLLFKDQECLADVDAGGLADGDALRHTINFDDTPLSLA
ncbi:hypothetical protein PENSUB_436 [Penicillium subrubescens]|uniref:Uncharacterized protein n=1 Tax=Penicillium subrubescens TaxID=1316194 RepID=A0A1Q5UN33_9EURO|nr:hypothetical protein PENSUB_436 [Penicillium subrubescens]